MSRETRAAGFAFLIAFATLFVQVLVHRIVSAKVLNNYAFLVISLTMLGFAMSGVVLTRWQQHCERRLEDFLPAAGAGFVATLLLAATAYYTADVHLGVNTRPGFVVAYVRSLPTALLFALPFSFCGLALGTLLSARDLPTGKIYFFDLAGSAAGAFAVIPAISHLGVETALLACAVLVLVGSALLGRPRRAWSWGTLGVAALALLGVSLGRERLFAMTYPPDTYLDRIAKLGAPYGLEHVTWDPITRIEVSRVPPPEPERGMPFSAPSLFGRRPEFHALFQRMLTQNNNAYTYALAYDGRPASLRGIEETVYAAAYQANQTPRPRALIIGVGGGFDILTALAFDARSITAVEINRATLQLLRHTYRDYFRPWVDDPRLSLVNADGRHYLEAHDERYDVLQLSGVDSYSGTPGAAHVFSENYLYTQEAFDLYFSRLAPDGVLNVMRLEYTPVREMLRAAVTATTTLRRAGVARPQEHIVMLADVVGSFSALLVQRSPFQPAQVEKLQRWAQQAGTMRVVAAPGLDSQHPYALFLNLPDAAQQARFVDGYPFDVRPATDDRPFFFKYSFWWHVFPASPAIWMWTPYMEYSVILLLLTMALAAVVAVYVPLRRLTALAPFASGTRRFGVYFACLGVGYLAVEVALLQKLGLLLGHPNYALSVVLAALLLSTGVGAWLGERLDPRWRQPRFAAYLLAALVLVDYFAVLPRLPQFMAWSFTARVILTCAVVAPLGLCLGQFLPLGLDRLKRVRPEYAPWAWGLNGMSSVVAPVLAVALSMAWGIGALFVAAIPVYLLGALALGSAGASEA